MTDKEMPVVMMHVGAPVSTPIKTAGLKLNQDRHYDNTPVIIDYPVRVRYSDPKHPFDLPPTRFVFLTQRAGIITGVETSPVLTYVDLPKAHAVVLELTDTLRRAGWTLTKPYPTDYSSAEKALAGKIPKPKIERMYGEWKIDTVTTNIYIKKVSDATAELEQRDPEELYLPSIDISDPVLEEELTKKVYERRQQVTGNLDRALPLSAWTGKQ